MFNGLLIPPMPGREFIAGALPPSALATALGLRHLFASCGAEPPSHRAKVDSREAWLLLATLGGGGVIRTAKASYEAAPTTLFVVPPGTAFSEAAAGHTAWSWLCLRFELAPDSPLFVADLDTPWLEHPGLPCFQLIGDIVGRLQARTANFEAIVVARVVELLGLLAGHLHGTTLPPPSQFVDQACERMRAEPGRDWSIAELARLCGMSASSFAHRFRAETGTTPKQWLLEERMREARRRLADRDGIKAIAEQLGFSSRYHFTRAFTRLEGMPPGRFQRLASRR